ncbi:MULTISPECIES: thioredoxin family protein [unclassified Pseudomonas]|uniref:thioredoxin family protein n=1 Tax=unclassified Pseudomonas TaxID=196821 RepID=UPI0011A4F248|nr:MULTISPECIES: thioredoxin family protein [unclassified Pseudomonas]
MSSLITHVASQKDYRKALKNWRPVIFYFGHPQCYACGWADPLFCGVADTFQDRAVIYKLSTHESPRHPEVTGTPTVLFYKGGKLCRKLKGIGDEVSLAQVFAEHVGRTKPRRPPRRHHHDVDWLRERLRTLCTARRAPGLVRRRAKRP